MQLYPSAAEDSRRVEYLHPPFRPPSEAEPICVNLRVPPPDARVALHHHPWAQMVYPTRGTMRVSAAGTAWVVPAFRAVWIPPLIDHTVDMLGRVELCTLYIAPEAAPLPLDACLVLEVSPLLRSLFQALTTAQRDHRYHLMTELALEEMRRAPPLSLGLPLPRDRRLQALCEGLMDNPASEKTLKDWSRHVGASERTLARLFQDEMHTSFAAWRQQLRLARAVAEMGRGRPLGQVAAEVGYANPAAFGAMFKRALGVPPSRFCAGEADT